MSTAVSTRVAHSNIFNYLSDLCFADKGEFDWPEVTFYLSRPDEAKQKEDAREKELKEKEKIAGGKKGEKGVDDGDDSDIDLDRGSDLDLDSDDFDDSSDDDDDDELDDDGYGDEDGQDDDDDDGDY